MSGKLKQYLGFPYPKEYEAGYNRDLMRTMHKPLLIAVVATLLFVTWLLFICIFYPESIAPQQYIAGLMMIHFVFMVFTIVVLLFSIGFRRQLFQYPKMHVIVCNIYATGICLWASILSAYADYSAAVYSSFVFVMLCVSMISMFKPWLAVVVYSINYLVYFLLAHEFTSGEDSIARLNNAVVAVVVGVIIAIAFYRFRTRNYYDKQIISRQMEEIRKINGQLQQLIHIDNLTGLFNRRFYEEALPQEIEKAGETDTLCGMMFDIDYFKAYNDKYGHLAGDECLRRVAVVIRDTLPGNNAFAVRYGGEEFFAFAGVSSRQEALSLAENIRDAVEKSYISHVASPFGKITLSGGIVFFTKQEAHSLGEVTKKADEALYCSKREGRNKVTEHTEAAADG